MLFDDNFYKSFDEMSRRILGEFAGLPGRDRLSRHAGPALNLSEDGDVFTVELALPGFKPESLDVKVENDFLTVSGERPAPENEDDRKCCFAERSFGRFERQVRLSRHVDRGGIKADYENGVLTITIPKAEEARPKKIDVNIK